MNYDAVMNIMKQTGVAMKPEMVRIMVKLNQHMEQDHGHTHADTVAVGAKINDLVRTEIDKCPTMSIAMCNMMFNVIVAVLLDDVADGVEREHVLAAYLGLTTIHFNELVHVSHEQAIGGVQGNA